MTGPAAPAPTHGGPGDGFQQLGRRLRRAARRIAYGLPVRWGEPARRTRRPTGTAANPLAAFARYNRAYFQRWLLLGAAIGVGAGVSMVLFFTAIGLCTRLFLGGIAGYLPPQPAGEGLSHLTLSPRPWLIPVATTLGGLLVGLVVYALAPMTAGGGTDASIETFHEKNGRMLARIPGIKLVASAITIGAGGSAGREGAAAQIVAGIGSWLGDVLHLDEHDRRIAVVAGIGAGVGTIFRAPFAGALFGAEVLYKRDFEADAIFPTVIASVVGYAIYGAFEGWTPVFGVHSGFRFDDPRSLVSFLILGVCCGFLGLLFHWVMRTSHRLFARVPASPFLKPALGGLLVGVIGILLPQALGMGYGWVQFGINSDVLHLSGVLMAVLVFAKMLTTSLTIGSGGSGGDVAPAMVIGGFLGGSLWAGLHALAPGLVVSVVPGAFVVVGMAAFFGGISKTPLAMILMVAEMTGQLTLIVPGMLATMIAYLITGETSLYSRQVATRLDSPAHKDDYVLPLLQNLRVSDAMSEGLAGAIASATPETPLNEIARAFRERKVMSVPVVENGRLVGMISASDLARVPPAEVSAGIVKARQVMSRALVRAYADESLYVAWLRMSRRGLRQLAVVERAHPTRLIGMLTADAIGHLLRSPITGRTNSATITSSGVTAPASSSTRGNHSARSTPRLPHGTRAGPAANRTIEHLARGAGGGDPLANLRVAEAMARQPSIVLESAPLASARELLDMANAVLVVTGDGRLVGILTRADLWRRADVDRGQPLTAGDVAVRNLSVAKPEETLRSVVRRMNRLGLRQLPVVARELPAPPLGLLRRTDILAAYGRFLADDKVSITPQ